MTLVVTDEPPDRPAWVSETLRLVFEATGRAREQLLERVARTTDAELVAGTEDDWGAGQIAVHLLLIERGVALIALRLAKGEPPGRTGQPRPAATAVSRDGQRREMEGGAAFRTFDRGVHFVLAGSDTIGAVSVNPDPRESDLTVADDAAIRTLWPGATVVPAELAPRAAFAASGRTDLRGSFLWLAALLALADAALAGTIRGRSAPA